MRGDVEVGHGIIPGAIHMSKEEILEKYTFNGYVHQHYDETTHSYYDCYYPKYDVTKEDLIKATDLIIQYLYHSDCDSMQFQVITSEGPVNFFSEQAIGRMLIQPIKIIKITEARMRIMRSIIFKILFIGIYILRIFFIC